MGFSRMRRFGPWRFSCQAALESLYSGRYKHQQKELTAITIMHME
ncbi:hypothetical protein PFWH6_0933 [Pseudomonas fluorescens WH6]|nr:hypothetical protein PFWH6_0933 [Pseudomonas fluorescens WH6]